MVGSPLLALEFKEVVVPINGLHPVPPIGTVKGVVVSYQISSMCGHRAANATFASR